MYNPIQIIAFSLSFPHKVCFENFSTQISFGDRIAIIGRNGSGRSSLLKMIAEKNPEIPLAYTPQIIDDFDSLSGSERFNQALSHALQRDIGFDNDKTRVLQALLLDEPTNHLDLPNRKSLMRMLKSYYGTLIIVTHDKELLRSCVDILWHIDDGKITVFRGNYDDYMSEMHLKRESTFHQMGLLKREKKSMHKDLMKEQERASKSKVRGEKKVATGKLMKCVGDLKCMKAEKSQSSKLKFIDERKPKLSKPLSQIRLPEIIVPKFNLSRQDISETTIVSIVDGSIGYGEKIILEHIDLSIMSRDRIAIVGNNGSGKTTLIQVILRHKDIVKSGDWNLPHPKDIGFLDQHYKNLDPEKSAVEIISETNSKWSHGEIRKHLKDFLFRKNEEAHAPVKNLSGGEKARLSLAKIAAHPPKLLILDEITNNIDLETRDHIVEVLQKYPAAMIVISHDEIFLDKIGVEKWHIKQWIAR